MTTTANDAPTVFKPATSSRLSLPKTRLNNQTSRGAKPAAAAVRKEEKPEKQQIQETTPPNASQTGGQDKKKPTIKSKQYKTKYKKRKTVNPPSFSQKQKTRLDIAINSLTGPNNQ